MRHRRTIVWTSVTALLAAAAFAQQPGSSTAQPRTATGATRDAAMYPINASSDPKSALGRLEGVWKVEMRINPIVWHEMNSSHAGRAYGNDAARTTTTTSNPTTSTTPGTNTGSTGSNPTNPTNPGSVTPGTNEPNSDARPGFQPQPQTPPAHTTPGTTTPHTTTGSQPTTGSTPGTPSANRPENMDPTRTTTQDGRRTTGTSSTGGGMSGDAMSGGSVIEGYSEKRWIMGDDILQETCVMPDAGEFSKRDAAHAGSTPSASRPASTSGTSMTAGDAEQMLKSMSFLSFNEGTRQFDYVMMDSCEGGIKHATGTYDAASNRIEFDITDVMGGGHDGQHGSGTRADSSRAYDPSNPRGSMPASPTQTPGTTTGNDPNRPYDASNPRGTQPATPTQTPGTTTGNTPNRTTDPTRATDPSRPSMDGGTPDQNGDWSGEHAMKGENFRVVVEILSADQHRVTMYRDAGSESWQDRREWSELNPTTPASTTPGNDMSRPGSPTQPGTTPATTPGTTTGNQPRNNTTAQPGNTNLTNRPVTHTDPLAMNNSFNTANGVIVWQATYTRASAADAAEYRQALRDADLLQTTAEVETER